MLLEEEVQNTDYKTNENSESLFISIPPSAKRGYNFPAQASHGRNLVILGFFDIVFCLFLFWVAESIEIRLGWLYPLVKCDVYCQVLPRFFLYYFFLITVLYQRNTFGFQRHSTCKEEDLFSLLTQCNEELGWKPSQEENPCGSLVFAAGRNAREPRHGGLFVLACDVYRGHFKHCGVWESQKMPLVTQ